MIKFKNVSEHNIVSLIEKGHEVLIHDRSESKTIMANDLTLAEWAALKPKLKSVNDWPCSDYDVYTSVDEEEENDEFVSD